jgi:hypothetical protein
MIAVSARVADATLAILRSCGSGRRECMAYWTAPPGIHDVARVVHPRHSATYASIAVDGDWATAFFDGLPSLGERTVAQIHTHPGAFVRHSDTDDEHVLVPVAGFVSIVVPRFGRDGFGGAGIWALGTDGSWFDARGTVSWMTR